MIKTIEEIKSLHEAQNKVSLIINAQDYSFVELVDLARMSDLFGWKITFSDCSQLSAKEMKELIMISEDLMFDLR